MATCQIENNSFDFFEAKSGSYNSGICGNKKFMSLSPNTHIARVVQNTLYIAIHTRTFNH